MISLLVFPYQNGVAVAWLHDMNGRSPHRVARTRRGIRGFVHSAERASGLEPLSSIRQSPRYFFLFSVVVLFPSSPPSSKDIPRRRRGTWRSEVDGEVDRARNRAARRPLVAIRPTTATDRVLTSRKDAWVSLRWCGLLKDPQGRPTQSTIWNGLSFNGTRWNLCSIRQVYPSGCRRVV